MYFPLLLVLIGIGSWYIYKRNLKQYKLPPGPRGLPLIGNIHQLIVKNPFNKLSQWAHKYGKIYTIDLCTKKAIVINEPKLNRDILNTFASTGKFQNDSVLLISKGSYGVFNSDGEVWYEQRLFCVKKLKEFGFANKRMETLILSEADEICSWITEQNNNTNGKSLLIKPIFIQSVVNTVWNMVTGTKITLGDSEIAQRMELFMIAFQHTLKTGLTFVPWLKYVAPDISGYTEFNNRCLDIWNHIEKEFIEHKKSFKSGVQRDFIDACIEESGTDSLKWKNAVATAVELFLASSETTGSTLTWLLYYLAVNPDIQANLQNEIDTVIGESNQVSLDFKSRMPFTEAVILETMRMSSVAPIGAIHQLLEDLEIHNYKFPKGLIIISNIYHCHNNKNVWNDPEVFRPQLKGHVIPFQLGKRECLGKNFAKDIIFLFVTRIFQRFSVSPDESVIPEEYYKPDIGLVLCPPSLGLLIKPRI